MYWKHSLIIARPADRIEIKYIEGKWSFGAAPTGPEGGATMNADSPYPGAPVGSLIARIGKSLFLVGKNLKLTVPAGISGEICLGINEDLNNASRGDNSGSLTVEVSNSGADH
jgi:hypothetical protein